MTKPVKLVLVTAEHHPLHKQWVKLAEEIARETGLEMEIRKEDYVLLNECGEQDEFGMAWLPQLLVMLDDGSCKLVLSKLPLNNALQPDLEAAKKQALEVLSKLSS